MQKDSYISLRDQNYIERTRKILKELPAFCGEFFRGINSTTSPLTRHSYACDLRTFFIFLTQQIDEFVKIKSTALTLSDLNRIDSEHIEKYLEYLTSYDSEVPNSTKLKTRTNSGRTKARKLSSVRALSKYFFKKQKLNKNVAALIDAPRLHEKVITRLEKDEMYALIESSQTGSLLTKKQKDFHKYTQNRDGAIIMLFLGTGIRISELVGININDIDFKSNAFSITRKGGDQVILYFGEDVSNALQEYYLQRIEIEPANEVDSDAFFLSMQKKRITTRAVQNLVKKYSASSVPLKNISPHKLRSTYGTMLYHQTGDIYLVADVLGHKDVNTTKTHYAAQSDDNRRMAGNIIKVLKPKK